MWSIIQTGQNIQRCVLANAVKAVNELNNRQSNKNKPFSNTASTASGQLSKVVETYKDMF